MNDSASIHLLLIEDTLGDALMVTRRRARESGARDPIEVQRATTLQQGLDLLGKGEFESEPLVHRLRAAIERMQIQDEQLRVQFQLEETERIQSLGVLGAGASLGFDQLIAVVLDHIAGRGLGLAAARSAVRRQGGWIGAGNDPRGDGARFQVLLPVAG
jgi:hypothetical protein